MGEKRHRQQQRRQRRKAQGRTRPGGSAHDRRASVAQAAERELAQLLAGMAEIAARDAQEPADALEAEQWASTLIGTMHARPMPSEDVEALFLPGFVDALETLGTGPALATLRALGAVCAPDHGRRAAAAAERLAASGVPEPEWAAELGHARPTAAALMSEDAFDDGMSVMVEFAGPEYEPHTLGIYIDHNLGGLVKDAFLAGPLSDVRAQLERAEHGSAGISIADLDPAEARARVEAALYTLDHTYDPPVSGDLRPMRALLDARIRLLPDGFELQDGFAEITPDEREALLVDFLTSPEGRRWHGDGDAAEVARMAIDFGAGYNHGGPLRWSPVVVEIFMTSWLARKVTGEPELFARVPEVLPDWVVYAGRRNGVPAAPLREAVAAVEECEAEMLAAVNDPEAWGPAKAFAVAAVEAGVDLTDEAAVERFIQRYNDGLAA